MCVPHNVVLLCINFRMPSLGPAFGGGVEAGMVTSLSPQMVSWMMRHRRILHGYERLAMQGIAAADVNSPLAHTRAAQLAGDQFSAVQYSIVFKAVFSHIPVGAIL